MKLRFVYVVLLVNFVVVIRCDQENSEPTNLEQQFRVLSKQVTALLERREEDLKSIESNIRKEILDNSEVLKLRQEVQILRSQLNEIHSGNIKFTAPRTQNEKIKIQWFSSIVNELKAEINELQESFNSSLFIQNLASTQSEINLFKTEVSNLNQELKISRKKNEQFEAEIDMLKEELHSVKSSCKQSAVACGVLQNQFRAIQNEWYENKQDLAKSNKKEFKDHPLRHNTILKEHVIRLEENTNKLQKQTHFFKAQINKLQFDLKTINKQFRSNNDEEFDRISGNEIQNYIEANKIFKIDVVLKKMHNFSQQQDINIKAISNLTKHIFDLDKLHLSTLELLENVETLENKVDNSFPEFRREISKLEVQVNELSSEISSLKMDNKNIKESMKAISFSVSTLQEKTNAFNQTLEMQKEHVHILEKAATTQIANLQSHISKAESSVGNFTVTKSTINMVEELKSFENEYKSIVNKLPRDCRDVDGPSGIYLISPYNRAPILAHCDDGWTIFQKRSDGSINFNRNWNDYANGFGSVTGEHWLGNKHIHFLTKDNCTKLQINMKDIYGQYWQANYEDFRVSDFNNGFKLFIDQYGGNASNAFNYQNNMEFSTIDNDRDISNTHCANNYEGGWWFSHCQHANLNGRFNLGLTWFNSFRNEWIAVAQSEMRLKRRDVC